MTGDVSGYHFFPRRSAPCGPPAFTYLVYATGRPLSAQMSGVPTGGCLSNMIRGTWRASSYDALRETFVEARYADVTLPSVTLHEALTARRTLLAKGRREVDSRAIVRTAIAQRELVDAATRKTATARGGRGGPKSKVDDAGWGSLRGVDSSKPVPFVEDTE
jgi:hypothetical protein